MLEIAMTWDSAGTKSRFGFVFTTEDTAFLEEIAMSVTEERLLIRQRLCAVMHTATKMAHSNTVMDTSCHAICAIVL
jgi:hypothetical protein